jgi:hypothetical protein
MLYSYIHHWRLLCYLVQPLWLLFSSFVSQEASGHKLLTSSGDCVFVPIIPMLSKNSKYGLWQLLWQIFAKEITSEIWFVATNNSDSKLLFPQQLITNSFWCSINPCGRIRCRLIIACNTSFSRQKSPQKETGSFLFRYTSIINYWKIL